MQILQSIINLKMLIQYLKEEYKMNKLVSIIVPVYNTEKFIQDTIDCILNQTYKNFEVIFVDDMSTDRSIEIIKENIKKDKRIKLIQVKKKLNAANARNLGIKEAQGKYIAYLDSDDLWVNDKLEKQVKFMKKNNCAFSYTGYAFADINGKPINYVYVPFKLNYKKAIKNTTIFTSTVMFDIEKIKKEEIYMPNVKSEDTACWWKILKNNYEAYGLNEILTFYRRSSNTLSSNKIEAIKRIWNLYRNQEHMNILYSCYNFMFWAFNAVKRRI